jgi:hypothetical protein
VNPISKALILVMAFPVSLFLSHLAMPLLRVAGNRWNLRWGVHEGDAVNFSDPSWRFATGGVKHRDFVTFGEAFVKPFLGDLGAFI